MSEPGPSGGVFVVAIKSNQELYYYIQGPEGACFARTLPACRWLQSGWTRVCFQLEGNCSYICIRLSVDGPEWEFVGVVAAVVEAVSLQRVRSPLRLTDTFVPSHSNQQQAGILCRCHPGSCLTHLHVGGAGASAVGGALSVASGLLRGFGW